MEGQKGERSQRDPREILERFLAELYGGNARREGQKEERSQRDPREIPERDPTSLYRDVDSGISPPRLKLYNVYTLEGWGPTVFEHCMDPSASDGCACIPLCSFALSPLTGRLLKIQVFFDGR